MKSTDKKLLDSARAGDRQALESLLASQQDTIFRFGMKLCRDPEDAKDVLQDTLITMARSVQDFRGSSSLSTWLYTIARSFCIKKRRKSKFAPAREESIETDVGAEARSLEADSPRPDEAAERREMGQVIEDAIGALDANHREVLVLRDVEGLTAVEVAEVLHLSVAAVKSRLLRARLRVRETLAPALGMGSYSPAESGCPDVLTLYSKHLEGEISGALCAQMESHLDECSLCRGACDSLKQTLTLCRSTPATSVPTQVQDSVRKALREFLATTQ